MPAMSSIDLHGFTYDEAEVLVEDFFHTQEPPFEVITGHSDNMKRIVSKECEKFKYKCYYGDYRNTGCLTVIEGI